MRRNAPFSHLSPYLKYVQPMKLTYKGQGLAEYTLILVLVALTAIIALENLGNKVDTQLSTISDAIHYSGTGTGMQGYSGNPPP